MVAAVATEEPETAAKTELAPMLVWEEPTRQRRQPQRERPVHAVGDAAPEQDFAQQNEERNRRQQKVGS